MTDMSCILLRDISWRAETIHELGQGSSVEAKLLAT